MTVKNLNLNIDTYNLEDILNLFDITHNFNDTDLKNAKKIVLMTHPDKSGLPTEYFRFYTSAYKKLYFIWEFKNKSQSKVTNKVYNLDENDKKIYFSNDDNTEQLLLDNYLKKNNLSNDTKRFNKWFNDQFVKLKVSNEDENHGYGDWLKTEYQNEDIDENSQSITQDIDHKKKKLRDLIIHKDYDVLTFNNGHATITGDHPDVYSSDIFSNLKYDDLKKAYTETVVPVTNEDYENVKKFNNINDYKKFRSSQNLTPLSEKHALQYLESKENIENTESTIRGYKLAEQSEKIINNRSLFISSLLNIKNHK
jgi:hypothetical protein